VQIGLGEEHSLTSRLEAALEGIGDGILICDENGATVFQNQAAARLLSQPSDVLVARAVPALIRCALAGGRAERQLDLISPVRRSLHLSAFPIGPVGLGGAVVVVEDISERQRLDAIRRDFVANVSHELKTPTGALTLLAETLEAETDPAVVARLVRRMGGEAERLSRIIDDLLDLSRIESNEASPAGPVGVADIVSQAVARVRALADGLEVQVEVQAVSEGAVIEGDRRDLVSAVANLVENAVKYSDAGATVSVSAQVVGSDVTISVRDSGVGIPARDLERIFERFYRVDRARSRSTGGTGLGLSIVRHVAANHGGTVSVASVEGEGSTFVLRLPAVPPAVDQDPPAARGTT
jgi:two-component system sensor histidine kinase SenX3